MLFELAGNNIQLEDMWLETSIDRFLNQLTFLKLKNEREQNKPK